MGARDDVHAKGWDPTKDGALVPRTLGRAASWATSGWHFVRCAMEYARATTDYCVGHARNFRVHSHLPSFSENLVVRSPRVSRFTVNKKAQSVYISTPTLGCRDPPARHAHPARNSPCTAQPCGRGVATAHGWRAACGGRSPVGRAARRVCGPAERGPRDAFRTRPPRARSTLAQR